MNVQTFKTLRIAEITLMASSDEACWSIPEETLGIGIWHWQVAENTMLFSPGLWRLLGYSANGDEPTLESLVHPEDLADWFRALQRYLREDAPQCKHELRLRSSDGEYQWFLAQGKTVRVGQDGNPWEILGTLVDIADRKAMERSFLAQQAHYRSVVETVVDGIIVIDALGMIQSVNPAAERIFGYAPGELLGRSINVLMPEPYCSQHDRYLQRYLQTGEANIIGYGRQATGLRKNGMAFPISIAVNDMRIDGKVYFTGIIRDITTRKRSDEALLIAASVYRSMGEAILVTDADNTIITANEPFTLLTGYELHELIGKNPKILASGRNDRAFYEAMWRQLKTEGCWHGEIWNRRKNGQEYLESLTISIVYDDNDEVFRHVAVFSEIEPRV
jgi:sigma-B regulation protein RsbU (phosphoserine phosphatase)